MKKILKFMVVVLICGVLFLTGCNADTGVATQEPTKEPTLKELVEVFKNVDINLYPTMSPFIISLLNTSSAIPKNPIKQMNNIIHFKFFTINSFTFSFIFCFSFIFSIV